MGDAMKKRISVRIATVAATTLITAALVLTALRGVLSANERVQLFKGEISDSQCALNVHSLSRSHEEMLKKKNIGTTPAQCVRYCVKYLGGVYVLSVRDKVYKLDNQELADKYAGQKVKLTGVLDTQSNVIAVHDIEPEN
jgi:isoleucyl-tRNA synthetase